MSNKIISDIVVNYFQDNEENIILEQYGLLSIFNILNENNEVPIDIDSDQVKKIQSDVAKTLKTIGNNDKKFAQKMSDGAKKVFKKYGINVFLCFCAILNLMGGHPSSAMARALERRTVKIDMPKIETISKEIVTGGGLQYQADMINKFVVNNFNNYNDNDKAKMKNYIFNELKSPENNILFKFMVISQNYKFLKDATAELRQLEETNNNFKLLKIFKNKDNANVNGKYQVLGLFGLLKL